MSVPFRMRIAVLMVAVVALLSCSGSNPADSGDDGIEDPDPTSAAVYYVATSGHDSSDGRRESPWRTIAHAAATLTAGDTVFVRGGVYSELVQPGHSGKPDSFIVYAAFPSETVTIDGSLVEVPEEWGGLVSIYQRSYVKLSGFRVIHAGPGIQAIGILVDESEHVIVENCYTYDTKSSGIAVWDSRDVSIIDNEVELACNGGENECLTVAVTDGFIVRGNEVHHAGSTLLGGEGLDLKDGSSNGLVEDNYVHHIAGLPGIYLDAWDKRTHSITVRNNRIHDVGDGIPLASEMGGLLEDIVIENNIIYNTSLTGIMLSTNGPGASHPMQDIRIVNNTVYNCGGTNDWGGGIGIESPEVSGILIRNNICSDNLVFQIAVDSVIASHKWTIDHNLIDGFRGSEGELYGADFVTGAPKFLDPQSDDFHLASDSPARNAGSADLAPGYDYDGLSRPQDGAVDIGAFEVPEN